MALRPDVPMQSSEEELCLRYPTTADGGYKSFELHGQLQSDGQRVGASYVWLSYSIFFWIEPVFHHSALYWAECVGIYAAFLLLYVRYVNARSNRQRLWMIGGFALMGVATIPFNSGAACFLVYVAAMIPFSVESVRKVSAVMVAELLYLVGNAWWHYHFRHSLSFDSLIVAFFIPVAGVSNIFVAQGKRADARLRAAQAENAALAAVAERERIARDLHDVLGHTLSVIVLKAELAGRLLERDTPADRVRAAAEIGDVQRTARTALAEVREAITGYRAKGLAAELERARMTLEAAGVALEWAGGAQVFEAARLGAAEETVLALAMREAVTNIVRHARARVCTVRFGRTAGGLDELVVEDDGRGSTVMDGDPEGGLEGNGLRGMRERVTGLGGRFRLESNGQGVRGTRVTVALQAQVRERVPADASGGSIPVMTGVSEMPAGSLSVETVA